MKKIINNYIKKFGEGFYLPKTFLSLHFGFITAWFANDHLTPLFFSEAFAERSLFIKLGIVLIYTPFFSIAAHIVITFIEFISSQLVKKTKPYFDGKRIAIQGKNSTWVIKVLGIFKKKWFRSLSLILFIIVLSFLASYYIFGENLKAQWWIIDDHEIMRFLGDDGHLELKNIPSTLFTDTEIGDFGGKPRYRPAYYVLRLLETSLWGLHPEYFYFIRLIICSIFILVSCLIFKEPIGFIGSFIFTMAVMSFNYWGDIFSRLGPSETYGVLGFSLFCLGVYGYAKDHKSKYSILIWASIFFGAIISIGSKENMILLAFPVLWMLVNSIIRKRFNMLQIIVSILVLLFCAFIAYAVLSGISIRGGQDAYATDVSRSSILILLKDEMRTFPFSIIKYYSQTVLMIAISYALIAFGLAMAAFLQKETSTQTKKRIKKILIRCVVYLGCIYLLFLSQRIFYINEWPTGMRYDFPGKLGAMATLIILIDACVQLFNELDVRKTIRDCLKIGYCLLFSVIIFQNNYFSDLRETARDNARRTMLFTQQVNRVVEETSFHPDYPIIFQSFNYLDFEPIFSLKYFLQAHSIPNKIMVHVNGYTSQSFPENTLEKDLTSQLEKTSMSGGWEGFSPLENTAEMKGACFSIDFSGASNSECINLGRIW